MFMSSMVPRLFEVEASYSFIVSGECVKWLLAVTKEKQVCRFLYSLCIPESGWRDADSKDHSVYQQSSKSFLLEQNPNQSNIEFSSVDAHL